MSNSAGDRILFVHNPECSQAQLSEQVLGWIRDSRWAGGLDVVETQDPSKASNIDLIKDRLMPGVVLVSAGGDATDSDSFNALKRAEEEGLVGTDETSLLTVPTGNGNDLSRSLYGRDILRRHGKRLWGLLERGETDRLDGMKLEAEGHLDRYAHGYVGIGFTAEAAEAINLPEYRARRKGTPLPKKPLDGTKIAGAIRRHEPFAYLNGTGHTRQSHERLLTLIPRIAAGVIRVDTQVLDRRLVSVEIDAEDGGRFLPKAALTLASGYMGGIKGETMTEDEMEILLHNATAIQYDGEPDSLPADTVLRISHQREIVRAVV